MLTGLNTAYERANTYGHWSGDKERIAHLAATLRVTDTNITDVIVMNNRQGAINNGHNALFKIWGKQCDYVVSLILLAGGIEYEQKLKPNNSYELFKDNKTYWENQSWSD